MEAEAEACEAEINELANEIDDLLGEKPRISDLDIKTGKDNPLQH